MRKEIGAFSERREDNAGEDEEHLSITLRVPRFPKSLRDQFLMDGSPFICLFGNLYSVKNCPNCGGLPVELELVHEGRRYLFTCYQIVSRTGKVVAETDYDKLAVYLAERKEAMSGERV